MAAPMLETRPDPESSATGQVISPVLARLVGDVDRFRHLHWGRAPVQMSHPDDRFDDIFSLRALDSFVASAARAPTVRMVVDGEVLATSTYCTRLRLGGRELDDVVDPRRVLDQLGQGATLVLQSLHRTVPSVTAFARRLHDELSHPVQVNAYLTPSSAAGLAEHADRHDVIAVQLDGTKRWWVDGLDEFTVRPGDVVYVPKGTRHRAETTSEMSLHLTVGVIRVSARRVLERVLAEVDLDEPLPIGYRHDEHRDELGEVIDRALDTALDAIGAVELDDLVSAEQCRRRSLPTPPGQLASMLLADRLGLGDMVRCVAARPLCAAVDQADARLGNWDGLRDHDQWSPSPVGDERITIALDDRTLTVPAVALPALRALSAGSAVCVRDLPGLDESGRLVLARRLVREGACVIDEPGQ